VYTLWRLHGGAKDVVIAAATRGSSRSSRRAGRPAAPPTVRACAGRLSGLSVSHSKSFLYGAFVWARRALSRSKRRFSARAEEPFRSPLQGSPGYAAGDGLTSKRLANSSLGNSSGGVNLAADIANLRNALASLGQEVERGSPSAAGTSDGSLIMHSVPSTPVRAGVDVAATLPPPCTFCIVCITDEIYSLVSEWLEHPRLGARRGLAVPDAGARLPGVRLAARADAAAADAAQVQGRPRAARAPLLPSVCEPYTLLLYRGLCGGLCER
jgi:hypothetical protein